MQSGCTTFSRTPREASQVPGRPKQLSTLALAVRTREAPYSLGPPGTPFYWTPLPLLYFGDWGCTKEILYLYMAPCTLGQATPKHLSSQVMDLDALRLTEATCPSSLCL